MPASLSDFPCASTPCSTCSKRVRNFALVLRRAYLAGAAVVGFISYLNSFGDWQSAFLTLPIMYGIYRSFHLYLGRLENEKKRAELESQQVVVQKGHIEEISALQMRTIEALTLAIDTKDHTTSLHLNRVSRYVEQ